VVWKRARCQGTVCGRRACAALGPSDARETSIGPTAARGAGGDGDGDPHCEIGEMTTIDTEGTEPPREPGEVTRLLREIRDGDSAALDKVLSLIYEDLRVIARAQLRREYQSRSIEPTALVHEAYLKLVRGTNVDAADRAHLLGLAARAMRQVLIDHA